MNKSDGVKKALKWLLLTYVVVTILVILWQEFSATGKSQVLIWSQTPKVSVTYFFGTKRCSMCKNMEKWAREVVEKLPSMIANSATTDSDLTFEFQKVPWQDEKNKVYVDHYKLLGNTLIISYEDKGTEVATKELADIWDVAHDEKQYKDYIGTEFTKFIIAISSQSLPPSKLKRGNK